MGRFGLLVSVVAVVLLGIAGLAAQPVAMAQEATPGAEEMEGVTFEPVTFAYWRRPAGVLLTCLWPVSRSNPAPWFPMMQRTRRWGSCWWSPGRSPSRSEGPVTVTRGAALVRRMAAAEAEWGFQPP